MYAQAIISIDIDPDELQSIGEVLVESYLHHNLIQRKKTPTNSIITHTKKILCNMIQFSAITMSLVAANLLTASLQPLAMQQIAESDNTTTAVKTVVNGLKPSDICPYDFGCDDFLCWRTCDTKGKQHDAYSWCYTAEKPKEHQFNHCVYSHECSPCWDCLSPCNAYSKK